MTATEKNPTFVWSKAQAAQAVRDIESAPDSKTLLGDDPEREFKRLSRLVHPDRPEAVGLPLRIATRGPTHLDKSETA